MKKLLAVFSFAFMFLYANAQEVADLKEPSSEVKELMKKHKLKEVDFDYVKKMIGVGNRGAVEAILIDARPHLTFSNRHPILGLIK